MKRPLFWTICLVLCLAKPVLLFAQKDNEKTDPEYQFAKGVRIVSQGEPIDVTVGHAAPHLYDFDGDGRRDLLVGEFGSGRFEGETTSKDSPGHALANARLRIYLNTGTNQSPKYDDGFKYLQAGSANASVPNT